MFWAVLITLLFLYFIYGRFVRQNCTVPGPIALPIVGYGPFLGSQSHVTMANLSKKYGDIVLVQIGMRPVVVLNSIEVIREAFARPEICSRPKIYIFEIFNKQGGAFSFRPNDLRYNFLRKCAVRALAIFTKSNKSLLPHLSSVAFERFKTIIEANGQKPIDVKSPINNLTFYVIGNLSFGNQFDPDHPFIQDFQRATPEINRLAGPQAVAAMIPPIEPLLYWQRKKLEELAASVIGEEKKLIANHHKRTDGLILDIQDALDSMVDQTGKDEARRKINIDLNDIKSVGLDLFGAGFSTTSEHTIMTLAVLSYFPQVQDKLHQELMDVVGYGNEILLEHREQLNYFQAFQTELIRFFTHIPLSLAHATTEDVYLRGYFIPKDTMVISNLYAVHYNPQIFPDPQVFKPERFLHADGSLNDLVDQTVGFGLGLRKCPGELLARQELFLFTSKLVAQYKVQLSSFEGNSPFDCLPGFSSNVKNFTCIFEPRKAQETGVPNKWM